MNEYIEEAEEVSFEEGLGEAYDKEWALKDEGATDKAKEIARNMLNKNMLELMEMDDYINLVCDQLEILPPEMIVHRLTGDAPRPILISPPWSFNKRTILNRIDEQLNLRNTWQGKKYIAK